MLRLLPILLLFPLFAAAQPKTTLLPGFKDSQEEEHSLARDAKTGDIYMLFCEWEYVKGIVEYYEYSWDVEVLSKDLKQKRAANPKVLEMPKGQHASMGKLFSFNGNTFAIFFVYDRKKDMNVVYRAAVSEKGFGAFEEIGILPGKYWERHQLQFAFSADSTRFLIAQYPITNFPKMGGYSFLVLDQDCRLKTKGVLQMPTKSSPRLVGMPMVTNNGAIWAPVWTNKGSFRQEIWIWQDGSSQPQRIDASPLAGHVATDIQLVQSPYDGYVYAGGVFAAASGNSGKSIFWQGGMLGKDKASEQGTFVLKLDSKNGQILNRTTHEFSEKTMRFWGKKTDILSKEEGINWLIMAAVIPNSDGSLWVVADQACVLNKQVKGVYNNPYFGARAYMQNRVQHGHESAILVRYGAQGERMVEQVLGRSAWSFNRNSVKPLISPGPAGELLLFYIGRAENIEQPVLEEKDLKEYNANAMAAQKRKGCLGMACVYPDGKTTLKWLQDEKVDRFSPSNHLKINNNKSLVFYPEKGEKYGIIAIDWQ